MKKFILIVAAILICGSLLGYVVSWLMQPRHTLVEEQPQSLPEALPEQVVELYFAAADGSCLIPEMVEIPGCDEDSTCMRSLLEKLIAGPGQPGAVAVLPPQTKVLSVRVKDDQAWVDLSREFVDHHPGGSLSELLTGYSIVNSLRDNFLYIRQVQLLVEGEKRKTLKGHLRIDQPIQADLRFNHPADNGDPQPQTEQGKEVESVPLSVEQLIEDAG